MNNKPICPDCKAVMVKTHIELEDGSGWFTGWGCDCKYETAPEVKRIYPGAVNGLINWMEENFHDIDSFVVTFRMKDQTSMTIHHADSYYEALAIAALNMDTIQRMSGDFVPSKGGES